MSVLLSADRGAVRTLTLNRPEKKNAFDLDLTQALWDALDAANADDSVRVVVVTGAGDTFSAGADLSLFLLAANPPEGVDISIVARLHEPMRAMRKPVIAAVQGRAVGMGVTLLPHFDLVYAVESASFMVPFVSLGLVVEYGGSHTLPRLIGHQRARELLLRGAPVDAATAERWGLATRVFPDDTFASEVAKIVDDLAALPTGAVSACRGLLNGTYDRTLDEAIAEEDRVLSTRYGSEENVEAVMRFLSRPKG